MIAWQNIIQHAECVATRKQISTSIDALATQVTEDYHNKNPIVLCLMNGGLFITAELTRRLDFPLRIDYLHATRYRGTTTGKDLQWIKGPAFNLANEHVLIVDDIFDEGVTLQKVEKRLRKLKPKSLKSLVLVDKLHERKAAGFQIAYTGMQLEDRYLFGCGMDYFGHWRHLPQIYAVPDEVTHEEE
ncbi:MAG: hypoxanthine-guanine phosphoribosyltransferase [Gammaproteobacteria bacterium]|nr:hypoxanthine-guanine phosphoribosyltransferase [Gammaproteobacteria bacterium]NNM12920.1 hypoxanthine-guanine phosphoribosyltransferase [Gammaproteobacteria bacterium]